MGNKSSSPAPVHVVWRDVPNPKHVEEIKELKKQSEEAKRQTDAKIEEAKKPEKDRARKVVFVNQRNIPIQRAAKGRIMLMGQKGVGKSTFRYLRGEGKKPEKTHKDGTTRLEYDDCFLDAIGVQWTAEYILKMIVLLIYHGFPQDLIIISDQRVDQAFAALQEVCVRTPMLVVCYGSSGFWRKVNKGQISLEADGETGIRHLAPADAMEEMYDMEMCETVREKYGCKTITHEDDLELLLNERKENGIDPFGGLLERLGKSFVAPKDNDPETALEEQLFRLIYVYEKIYKGKENEQLDFLNKATIREFDHLD